MFTQSTMAEEHFIQESFSFLYIIPLLNVKKVSKANMKHTTLGNDPFIPAGKLSKSV